MKVEKQTTNGFSESTGLEKVMKRESKEFDSEALLKRAASAPARPLYQELIPVGKVSSQVESE